MDMDHQMMERLRAFMEDHLSESVPIQDMADHLCMSRTLFYNKIRSITGLTPNSKRGGKIIGHVSLRMVEVEPAIIALAGRGTGTGDTNYDALEKTVLDAMDGRRGILTLMGGGKR